MSSGPVHWRIDNGRVLAAAAAVAPAASVVSHLVLAPLIAAVAALILARSLAERSRPRLPPAFALILGALAAWGGLSLAWSIDPGATLLKLGKLLPTLLAGLIVVDAVRRLEPDRFDVFGERLTAGFCAALALLAVERVAGAPLRRLTRYGEAWLAEPDLLWSSFNTGAVALSLFVWPVALQLWRRGKRATGLSLCAATLLVVAFYPSNTAIAAMAAGGVVLGLVFCSARFAPAILTVLMVVATLAMPAAPRWFPSNEDIFANRSLLTHSGAHRLVIWRAVAERVEERPALGWGLDTSPPILHDGPETIDSMPIKGSLHPHNMLLQVWLEMGVVGAALLCALTAAVHFAIRRLAPGDRAFLWGLVVAGWISCLLAFGIWQTWWVAALWFAAAFAMRPLQPAPS